MSSAYQVHLEWGVHGLAAHESDIVVVADHDGGPEGDALRAADAPLVLEATLDGVDAVAHAVLDEQARLGRRASVTIIAAGDVWQDGSLRISAADQLLAGRVVDALAGVGIDFHSPHAAIACAAAVALRGATRHLISAEAASLAASKETA